MRRRPSPTTMMHWVICSISRCMARYWLAPGTDQYAIAPRSSSIGQQCPKNPLAIRIPQRSASGASDPAEITARWPWIEILDALAGVEDLDPGPPRRYLGRVAGAAGRPLGDAYRQRVLRALLPDAARPRGYRVLVGAGGEPVPGHAPRD